MYVRLSASWKDSDGKTYSPGETVEVDQVTLAKMEMAGVVDGVVTAATSGKPGLSDPQYPGLT